MHSLSFLLSFEEETTYREWRENGRQRMAERKAARLSNVARTIRRLSMCERSSDERLVAAGRNEIKTVYLSINPRSLQRCIRNATRIGIARDQDRLKAGN